jgi:hypothetical protein
MHRQGFSQRRRITGRQLGQAGDSLIQQHLAPLAADATHLTEVTVPGSLLIAQPPPTAQHALLAIRHQGRRLPAVQIDRQLGDGLVELGLQAAREGEALPLQPPASPRHHQRLGHRRLLMVGQQAPPEGQHQPVLPGEVAPLTTQHRPVGMLPPHTGARHPLQQGRMGLQLHAIGPSPPQSQAHHTRGGGPTGGLTMAGPLGQQTLKTGQLVAEGQGPVGGPLAPGRIPVAIEPGAALAAQPAAQ